MSETNRQILYVWNYREWGGAQIYFMSLMKEAKKYYSVTVLVPADSDPQILSYLESIEVPVEFLPPTLSDRNRKGIVGKLNILLYENKVVDEIFSRQGLENTIVHIDLGFWQSFLALFRLSRKLNVFTTVHTGLSSYEGWRRLRWATKGKPGSSASIFST